MRLSSSSNFVPLKRLHSVFSELRSSSASTAAAKILIAAFIPLAFGVGCLDLENKPKDPLVPHDAFSLMGTAIGTEGSLERGDARITVAYTSSGSSSSFTDVLALDQNDDFISYGGTEWRIDEDYGYYKQKNYAYGIMLPNADTTTFVALDTRYLAMGVFSSIGDLPTEDTVWTPPDLTAAEYNCVTLEDQFDADGNPDPDEPFKIQTYTAQFYASDDATLSSTTPGESLVTKSLGYDFSSDNVLIVTDAVEDAAMTAVFKDAIDLNCDEVNVEDEEGGIFRENPYAECSVNVGAFGGSSEDGSVVQFAQVAYVDRVIDASLFDGTKYASATQCNTDEIAPCSHPVTPVEPETSLTTINVGWKQRIEWNVCIRKAIAPVSNAILTGTYWVATLNRDNDENSLILSEYTSDGSGSGTQKQISVTNNVVLREHIMDYNVDTDGELVIDGRYGAITEDGSLFVYDASKSGQDIHAIAIGIRQAL